MNTRSSGCHGGVGWSGGGTAGGSGVELLRGASDWLITELWPSKSRSLGTEPFLIMYWLTGVMPVWRGTVCEPPTSLMGILYGGGVGQLPLSSCAGTGLVWPDWVQEPPSGGGNMYPGGDLWVFIGATEQRSTSGATGWSGGCNTAGDCLISGSSGLWAGGPVCIWISTSKWGLASLPLWPPLWPLSLWLSLLSPVLLSRCELCPLSVFSSLPKWFSSLWCLFFSQYLRATPFCLGL